MIPDDKIAEVRERAGIVEVISDYISLKKSGANFQGLCPFHGEKTPSFNVNPGRGIFHCFGCGVGGNVVTFVMKMEGISFPEAVKLLAKRVGVEIEERLPTSSEIRRKSEKDEQLKIVATAAGYYAQRKSSGGYFDLFRNRLLFTIADLHGQPIGFGGRVLDNSLPKYINSPESPLYQKSDVLFGIDLAKQSMREERSVVIVEGYFDHLALYRSGIRNVVATCGTALTKGHFQLIKRYADKVYLLFDSDSAGRKATLRAMELLLSEQMPCFVIELPQGDDPDSFLANHSTQAFYELMKVSRPALDYYLRELVSTEDTGTVAGKKAVADQFRPFLQKLTDPLERDLYLKELSRLLSVDVRTFGTLKGNAGAHHEKSSSPRIIVNPADSLVALLFRYPEIAAEFRETGTEALLPVALQKPAARIIDAAAKGENIAPADIIETDNPGLNVFAALLVDDSHLEGIDPVKALHDFRKAVERETLKMADAKSLQRELLNLDYDAPRYKEILEILNDLRSRKSQL